MKRSDEAHPQSEEILSVALKASRMGREILLHYFGRLEQIEEKFQAGLVSEADRESERAMKDYLQRCFPEFDFLGEESTQDLSRVSKQSEQGRWILDPLDGTTNYIHRFPVFAVSLGFEWRGKIQVAVIDAPQMGTGEVYTARRGHGAKLNGRPLQITQPKDLKDAFLATGFIGENEDNLEEQMRIFPHLLRKCRGVRRAGAAAYDLALVARGIFDAYWEKGIKPWDAAAGILLVEEAGGVVQSYRGHDYHPFLNSVIAGSGSLVSQIQKEMSPFLRPDTD